MERFSFIANSFAKMSKPTTLTTLILLIAFLDNIRCDLISDIGCDWSVNSCDYILVGLGREDLKNGDERGLPYEGV